MHSRRNGEHITRRFRGRSKGLLEERRADNEPLDAVDVVKRDKLSNAALLQLLSYEYSVRNAVTVMYEYMYICM